MASRIVGGLSLVAAALAGGVLVANCEFDPNVGLIRKGVLDQPDDEVEGVTDPSQLSIPCPEALRIRGELDTISSGIIDLMSRQEKAAYAASYISCLASDVEDPARFDPTDIDGRPVVDVNMRLDEINAGYSEEELIAAESPGESTRANPGIFEINPVFSSVRAYETDEGDVNIQFFIEANPVPDQTRDVGTSPSCRDEIVPDYTLIMHTFVERVLRPGPVDHTEEVRANDVNSHGIEVLVNGFRERDFPNDQRMPILVDYCELDVQVRQGAAQTTPGEAVTDADTVPADSQEPLTQDTTVIDGDEITTEVRDITPDTVFDTEPTVATEE